MSYKPFYISSFENESGLDQYYESFLIPEKAFPILEDAFAWRGRIRRRDGFEFLGRLRRVLTAKSIGNSGASPWTFNIYATLAAPSGPIVGEPNAQIEPGSVTIVIGGAITFTDDGMGLLTSITPGNTGIIVYATGDVTLFHTAGPGIATTITFSYFPGLPVMGLPTLETDNVNDETLIAFDQKYAYIFSGTQFVELPSAAPTTWNGNDADFFWAISYFRVAKVTLFWATNFNKGITPDPIRYWNSTTWTNFLPAVDGVNFLQQCRILLPYKNRLLALNTYEGTTLAGSIQFPQRARWSQNGDPTDQVNGWLDNVIGRGGFIDAPTSEQIISAEFIKDVLLVKFERSSWKLLYTGNETLPFVWQKINTELGAESTFSLVPFDRGVFSVGNVGVLTDDSINVSRIDFRIPYTVFNINNSNDGPKRVHGIRDYSNEVVYWTFPTSDENQIFPNKILLFNYINETWSIFNDSFTCFGYFQRGANIIWATLPYDTWANWTNPWNSGITQAKYPNIVGGNQHGFVEILAQQGADNDPSLYIHDILPQVLPAPVQIVIPNHNLQSGQFVIFTDIQGTGVPNPSTLNDIVYKITVLDANTITLEFLNAGVITNQTLDLGGVYIGGGVVEVFNNINITTKRFSPLYEMGSQVRLGYIDFFLDKTTDGELTVDLMLNESDTVVVNDNSNTNIGLLGNNIVLTRPESPDIPYQANQQKIWHRFYTYAIAQNFQLTLTFSDLQMFDQAINASSVFLHAMTLYLSQNARMIQ